MVRAMSEKVFVVPEGMLKAAVDATWMKARGTTIPQADARVAHEIEENIRASVADALRWLSENPIKPTSSDIESVYKSGNARLIDCICEWQRRMFLAPEPEVPTEIRGLIDGMDSMAKYEREWATKVVLKAFRLGQKSGGK